MFAIACDLISFVRLPAGTFAKYIEHAGMIDYQI